MEGLDWFDADGPRGSWFSRREITDQSFNQS